jgi:uncharacterized membrane protein YgcG
VHDDETVQILCEQNRRLKTSPPPQIVVVSIDFLGGEDIEKLRLCPFNDWRHRQRPV